MGTVTRSTRLSQLFSSCIETLPTKTRSSTYCGATTDRSSTVPTEEQAQAVCTYVHNTVSSATKDSTISTVPTESTISTVTTESTISTVTTESTISAATTISTVTTISTISTVSTVSRE